MNPLHRYTAGLAALLLASSAISLAAAPKAPPLPRGSEKLQMKPGVNPIEVKRDKHAHRRPKKDKSRDDTLPRTVPPDAPIVKPK